MKQNILPPIFYIALLGPRDLPEYINVPQKSVVNSMLRYLGNLPQSMMQFVYGVEYYELLKQYGLQLGYDIKIIYPDATQDNIDMTLAVTSDPKVILLCTDDEQSIKTYNKLFNGKLGKDTLCILYDQVKQHWQVPCSVAHDKDSVWAWFYDYATSHYEIDDTRQPFSVPIFTKKHIVRSLVFTPTRVNTQIFNSMIGNWGYEREYTEREVQTQAVESSLKAFQEGSAYERQDMLVEQIQKIRDVESMVGHNIGKVNTTEDQYRSPLIMAMPYTSIEMRKMPRTPDVTMQERTMADFAEAILGYHYTKNYTVQHSGGKFKTEEQFLRFCAIQKHFLEPRMLFFDIVGQLHCSLRFSPYLRLPIMGKNINSELSFVGIKSIEKLANSPSRNKSIRKAMEKIGKKMADEALAPSVITMLENTSQQIVALTDLPVEWLMINGVPLGFTNDVCRIPETPAVSMLSQYVESKFLTYVIPKDIMKRTLVIFGNDEDAFKTAQEPVVALSEKHGYTIRRCLNKDDFFKTVSDFDPDFLIVDCHGGVDEDTHQSFLKIGNDTVTGDDVIKSGIHPRLVFLSACNTFTTYNTISTIANAFFQAGSLSVTTSYMPVEILHSTILYTRLLNNLSVAAVSYVHRNWLSFMSHLLRTSYIQAPIVQMASKNIDADLNALGILDTKSMFFKNRRATYKNLNDNAFNKTVRADYQYIIPHYLMYSTLGRADMIRFEVGLNLPEGLDKFSFTN